MDLFQIQVKGLVQGVGFRPFIYRLATQMKLLGNIQNNNEGVLIHLNCSKDQLDDFISKIYSDIPIGALITNLKTTKLNEKYIYNDFKIELSSSTSNDITNISPDLALCEDCLFDMKNQKERIAYPFVNCTNCGPRFSIIKDLPYDRDKTTMSHFKMCKNCQREYNTPLNRRFHAQPNACNVCGPHYQIISKKGNHLHSEFYSNHLLIEKLCSKIKAGDLISIKGLGGYNIICNAFDVKAIEKLRKIKQRYLKPFAVMFSNMEEVKKYTYCSLEEELLLKSSKRPIVLLPLKNDFSKTVTQFYTTIGVILPYLPIHYLLFENLDKKGLIFTSGNLKEEPIIIDNTEAREKILPLVSLQADHNRAIINRVDDSIVQYINHTPRIIRRSRGYVPTPFKTKFNTEGILATGAQMVNTFSIGKGKDIILSQYIGDLDNNKTMEFYQDSINRFSKLFRFQASCICCDLHPDYFTTKFAENQAQKRNIPILYIQHHHAHAVACMQENHIYDNALCVIMDGTGYGTDGNIWGSEFMICNYTEFKRIDHFDYIPLPGNEKAIKEPWRTALSFMNYYQINPPTQFSDSFEKFNPLFLKMIHQHINSPLSCGAARIFDAVSALLNLCTTAHFQAEAPLRLEHICNNDEDSFYEFDEQNPLNNCSLFQQIVKDIEKQKPKEYIAAVFHNTIVKKIARKIELIIENEDIPRKVILSGGCFQNKRLSTSLEKELLKMKITPIVPSLFPVNDGGISLGQLSIAANKMIDLYA